jgi:hypothetical protein
MLQKGNVFGESFPPEVKNQIELREYLYGQGFESYLNYNTLQTAKRTEEIQYLNANNAWVKLVSSVDVYNTGRFKNTAIKNLKIENNSLAKQYVLFGGVLDSDSHNLRGGLDIAGERTSGDQTSFNYPINPKGDAYGVGGLESGFKPMPGIQSATIEHLNNGTLRKAVIKIKAYNRAQFEIIDALFLRLGYSMLLEWGHTIIAKGTVKDHTYERDPSIYSLEDEFLKTPQARSYEDFLTLVREGRAKSQGNYDGFIGRISNYTWEFATDGSYDVTLYAISQGDVIESLNMNSVTVSTDNSFTGSGLFKNATENIYPYKDKHDLGFFLASITDFLSDKIIDDATSTGVQRGIASPMTEFTYFPGTSTNLNAYATKFSTAGNGTPDLGQFYIRLGYLLEFLEKKKILVDDKGKPMVRIDYDVKTNLIPLSLYTAPLDPSKCIFTLKDYVIYDKVPTYKEVRETKTVTDKGEIVEENTFIDGLFWFDTISERLANGELIEDTVNGKKVYYEKYTHTVTETKKIKTSETTVASTAVFYDLLEPSQYFPDAGFVEETLNEKKIRAGKLMNVFFNIEYLLNAFDSLIDDETGKVSMYAFLQKVCDGFTSSTGNYNKLTVFLDEDTNTVRIIDKVNFPNKDTVVNYLEGSTDFATFNIYGFDPVISNKTLDYYKGNFIKNFSIRTELTKDTSAMIAVSAAANNQSILGEDSTAFSKWNEGLTDRVMKYFNNPAAKTQDEIGKIINDAQKRFADFIIKESSGKYTNGIYDGPRVPAWNTADFGAYVNSVKTLIKYQENQKAIDQQTQSPGIGFLPLKVSLTMKGLSGMKILQEFKIISDFLPSNYPESLRFLVTNIKHELSNNSWETTIETISAPESYTVTPEVSRRDENAVNNAVNNKIVKIAKLSKKADQLPCGIITRQTTDPATLILTVINNIEGGYYNPAFHTVWDGGASGETMFGEDRETGKGGQYYAEFWALVDKLRAGKKWAHYYDLKDRPADQKALLTIATKRRINAYKTAAAIFKPEVRKLVESDGRLLFHFYYANWNGPAFFNGWAKIANQQYAAGVTTADAMLKVMLDDRIAGALRAYPLGAPTRYKKIIKKQGYFNGISLIKKGGYEVAQLVGYGCTP